MLLPSSDRNNTRAFEIASAAVAMERSSRHLYLQQVCESDLELRATVEQLLSEAENDEESFTLRAPWGPVDLWADEVAFSGTDRYQVRKRLGSGAFGTVYEAWDAQEQRRVAVKVLQQRKPAFLLRFKREFRSLANLRGHANIVRLHELHGDEKHWFYTMELVEGQSFLSYVRPGGVRDCERLRKSLYQLWAGVRFLHERRQLHRDLKPANVMVSTAPDDGGRVVILDFGLVKELGEVGIEQSVAIAGSPAYMAPEQGEKGVLSEGTDWYAVGVMLYQALTGSLPFSGTLFEVLLRKRQNEAPDVRELDPSIDADLSAICRKLLSRDVDQRLAGAADLEGVWKPDATPSVAAPPSKGSEEIFVGRGEERRALEESLQAVLSGRQAVVGVIGPSGIGKSALVRQFLKDVKEQAPDSLVLTGRCYEAESVPFKTLDAVIDELSQHLQSLSREELAAILPRESHLVPKVFPVMGEVRSIRDSAGTRVQPLAIPDAQEARQRAFVAMRELLGRLADRRPVAVWVDDLQWGDLDSLAFVEEVVCGAQAPSMLWVFSYRQEDRDTSPVLQGLREQIASGERWKEIAIRELAGDEARLLAGRLLLQGGEAVENPASADVDLLVTESGGSPLFLQELVRSAGEVVGGGLGLKQVILRRVSQLPEVAREVMEVVALAGQRMESDEIVQVLSDREARTTLDGIEQCIGLRLLRSAVGRGRGVVESYHDQIREAVTDSLAAQQKRSLHGRLAAVLSNRRGIDPERLVAHYEGAGDTSAAYARAVEAARQAEALMAFDQAATLYQWALALAEEPQSLENGGGSVPRTEFLSRIAECCSNAGRPQAAAAWYDQAAAAETSTSEAASARLRVRGTLELLRGGSVDTGLSRLSEIIRHNGGRIPNSQAGALLEIGRWIVLRKAGFLSGVLGGNSLYFQDFETLYLLALVFATTRADLSALFTQQSILAANRAPSNSRNQCLAHCLESIFEAGPGWRRLSRAEEVCRQAGDHASQSSDPYAQGMHALALATVYFLSGMPKHNLEHAKQAEEIFRSQCTGRWWEVTTARTLRICALGWSGRARDYTREVLDICSEARNRGDKYALSSLSLLAWSYLSSLFEDHPAAAKAQIDEGLANWSNKTEFDFPKYSAFYGLADTALYEGNAPEALEISAQLQEKWKASFFRHWQILEVMLLHLRSRAIARALCTGHPVEPSALKTVRVRLRSLGTPWTLGAQCALDAATAAASGQPRESLDLLSQAEANFERIGLDLFAQSCRWQRGTLLAGSVGSELIRASADWMIARGIRNPEKLVAAIVPVGNPSSGRVVI